MYRKALVVGLVLLSCGTVRATTEAEDVGTGRVRGFFVKTKVSFRATELKERMSFAVKGEEKGFVRKLTRVTASLATVELPAAPDDALGGAVVDFLRANAAGIDLKLKYATTFFEPFLQLYDLTQVSGNDWTREDARRFVENHNAAENPTYRGYLGVLGKVAADGTIVDVKEVLLLRGNLSMSQ